MYRNSVTFPSCHILRFLINKAPRYMQNPLSKVCLEYLFTHTLPDAVDFDSTTAIPYRSDGSNIYGSDRNYVLLLF